MNEKKARKLVEAWLESLRVITNRSRWRYRVNLIRDSSDSSAGMCSTEPEYRKTCITINLYHELNKTKVGLLGVLVHEFVHSITWPYESYAQTTLPLLGSRKQRAAWEEQWRMTSEGVTVDLEAAFTYLLTQ